VPSHSVGGSSTLWPATFYGMARWQGGLERALLTAKPPIGAETRERCPRASPAAQQGRGAAGAAPRPLDMLT